MTDQPRISAPFETQFDAGRLQEWAIQRLIRKVHTAMLVRVLTVRPEGDYAGFVDVQPLVLERTTRDVVLDQAPIYKLPYLRAQGGVSAIILDPAVGDIGLAVFAERDITAVVNTREQAAAATDRAYDSADGLYLGGFLNATPTQFIEFLPEAAGINITTPGDLAIQADGNMTAAIGGNLSIQVAGTIDVAATSTTWSGPVAFADPITAPQATIGGIPFTTHKHTAQGATAITTVPIP
jgi:hypothetical protein